MKVLQLLCVVLVLALTGCQPQSGSTVSMKAEYLTSEGSSNRPFSEAVRVGNMLYLSGTIGHDPATGKRPEGGIVPETHQALQNMKATLEKYGSSLDHVVKVTVMIGDMKDFGDMNAVYVTYFPNHKPARSTFGASGLAGGAALEIECVAVIP